MAWDRLIDLAEQDISTIIVYRVSNTDKNKMLTTRKNGGASVVSLPRSVLRALGVDNGSQLSYAIHGNTLSLTSVEKEKTLEELFAGVEDGEYAALPEDQPFLEAAPTGKEIL